jgi:hypothetical protein
MLSAGPEPLPQHKGTAGTWQKLLKRQPRGGRNHQAGIVSLGK